MPISARAPWARPLIISSTQGELLRRSFDAQLADRNTKGYDLLVGHEHEGALRKVQVKSVRSAPWYVRTDNFRSHQPARQTIYVLVGGREGKKHVRYFMTRNRDLKAHVHRPKGWRKHGFMPLKAVERYEALQKRFWGPTAAVDAWTIWRAASPQLEKYLKRDGERIVCPELGTRYPAAA